MTNSTGICTPNPSPASGSPSTASARAQSEPSSTSSVAERSAAVACVAATRPRPVASSGVARHGYQAARQTNPYATTSGVARTAAVPHSRPPTVASSMATSNATGIQAAT